MFLSRVPPALPGVLPELIAFMSPAPIPLAVVACPMAVALRQIADSMPRLAYPVSTAPAPSVPFPDLIPNVTAVQNDGNGASEPASPRRRLQSTHDLIELGRLKVADTLTIRDRNNSSAQVLDGRHVEFKGQRMTIQRMGPEHHRLALHSYLHNGMFTKRQDAGRAARS